MTNITPSTNKNTSNKQKNPKESTLREILDFAATYRFKHTDFLDIEYSLN
ncbi:MAG: hypothetical protein ACI30B_06060 [Paludibacteraceae bacterium]